MILPLSYDATGGIRRWNSLGNLIDGDCVVAAYYHVNTCKSVTSLSTFRKLLFRLGFKPPTNKLALAEYTAFLATLGEKPSPTQGIYPNQFLDWLKAQGSIVEWAQVDAVNSGSETIVHQAMCDFRGVMLAGLLTSRSYTQNIGKLWNVEPAEQPDPSLGHAVALVKYTPNIDTIVTWGYAQNMTPAYRGLCFTSAFVWALPDDPPDMIAKVKALKA